VNTRWIIGILCGLALVFLITHGWLFGIKGRQLEAGFQREIKVGMTRDQVTQLWSKTGDAPDPWFGDYVFVDWETFCYESGQQIQVTFDSHERVKSWSERPWATGC
jgi:hypothetical protein